jgi:hypothetical protein
MSFKIEEFIDAGGWARLLVIDEQGDPVVIMEILAGPSALAVVDMTVHLTPEVMAAIGRTWAQWADRAAALGVTL